MPNRQLDEESGVEGRDQAGERNLKAKSLPMIFKAMRLTGCEHQWEEARTKNQVLRDWEGEIGIFRGENRKI